MVRAPYFDKDGTKKGAWSEDEDSKLKSYIMKNGHRNWRELPNLAGLSRCGKSCRLRWVNYLCPKVKRGNYTSEEEDLIIELHKLLGSKWSMIASKLPGRSDNEIKNHWHTHLSKRANQNNIHPNLDSDEEKDVIKLSHVKEKEESGILVESLSSKSSSSSVKTEETSFSLSSDLYHVALNNNSSMLSNYVEFEDFWTTPFLPDTFSSKSSPEYVASSMGVLDNYYFSSYDHDMIMVDDLVW